MYLFHFPGKVCTVTVIATFIKLIEVKQNMRTFCQIFDCVNFFISLYSTYMSHTLCVEGTLVFNKCLTEERDHQM